MIKKKSQNKTNQKAFFRPFHSMFFKVKNGEKTNKQTRRIHRRQTPPRLSPLTLSCDLDLKMDCDFYIIFLHSLIKNLKSIYIAPFNLINSHTINTIIRGRPYEISLVDSIRMTVREIVIRTTPPRNAAAPIKAYVPEQTLLQPKSLKKKNTIYRVRQETF